MNAPFKSALSAVILTVTAVSLAGCSLLTGVPEGESDVFSITVGDCFNITDETADEVSSLPVVDCAEPHDQEAFAAKDLEGDSYPGADVIDSELEAFCTGDAFTEFIGISYDESIYYTSGLTPTEDSWANGDHELLCTVFSEDGQTTGSLEGIQQ